MIDLAKSDSCSFKNSLAKLVLAGTVIVVSALPAMAQTAAAGNSANAGIMAGTNGAQAQAATTPAVADDPVPPDPTLPKPKKKKAAAAAPAPADTGDPATTGTTAKPSKVAEGTDAQASGPLRASGCKTRGFTVNDYGKDGPTADAKRLLDEDIATWSKANGLQNVKIGPKKVDCFQFLNFVVFDEWTCTATAQICWKNGQ